MKTITRGQVRAARAFADWSIRDLAEKSGASVNTISRFESGVVDAQLETLLKLQDAFEKAGIEFPDEDTVSAKRLTAREKAAEAETTSREGTR